MSLIEMGELGGGGAGGAGSTFEGTYHKFHLGEMNEAGRYRKWDFL